MKGISAVVATILMLMITIALAGTAYMFISGVFTSKTAIALEIQAVATRCSGAQIVTTVKNDGTTASGSVTVTATNPSGGTFAGNTCTIASIAAGTTGSCTITRPAGQIAGTYSLTATSGTATPAEGALSCLSAT